jgi:hypothetical protein
VVGVSSLHNRLLGLGLLLFFAWLHEVDAILVGAVRSCNFSNWRRVTRFWIPLHCGFSEFPYRVETSELGRISEIGMPFTRLSLTNFYYQ